MPAPSASARSGPAQFGSARPVPSSPGLDSPLDQLSSVGRCVAGAWLSRAESSRVELPRRRLNDRSAARLAAGIPGSRRHRRPPPPSAIDCIAPSHGDGATELQALPMEPEPESELELEPEPELKL